jgi:hypothetical protein
VSWLRREPRQWWQRSAWERLCCFALRVVDALLFSVLDAPKGAWMRFTCWRERQLYVTTRERLELVGEPKPIVGKHAVCRSWCPTHQQFERSIAPVLALCRADVLQETFDHRGRLKKSERKCSTIVALTECAGELQPAGERAGFDHLCGALPGWQCARCAQLDHEEAEARQRMPEVLN